ncbi:MAG: DUF6485 family protein [Synergistaceae bacterium]|nr:DUF6485 family protein [Synergistaceae bacterium]
MESAPFCTCVDYKCVCHPVNHKNGCTPCVAKNLREEEIPVCFFRKIEPEMDRKQDYSVQGYARFVRDHKGL